jgi:hypothetical protein
VARGHVGEGAGRERHDKDRERHGEGREGHGEHSQGQSERAERGAVVETVTASTCSGTRNAPLHDRGM